MSTPWAKHWLAWTQQRASDEGESSHSALFLDDRCFADYASALLPAVGKFTQVGLDFLLRGDLRLSISNESGLVIKLLDEQLGSGSLTVLGEKASGSLSYFQS